MSGDRGFTVVEMMVSIASFLVVLSAILMMVEVATHNQARVANRVAVNQRARPVLTKVMNDLHSACVAPGIAPVQAGSGSSSISFISKSGSSVSPTPDRRVITLSGTTLSEQVYPATGGAPPTWTFSGTPSLSRQLLTKVEPGQVGDPPAAAPLFQYYAYVGGELSATPLPTPLSAADAARTVHVNVAFAASSTASVNDPEAAMTLSDSTTLRLEPASEDSAEVNLPCV